MGRPIKLAIGVNRLIRTVAHIKTAKSAENNLFTELVMRADKKISNESTKVTAELSKNNLTQRAIESNDESGSKTYKIMKEPIDESPIKADDKKLETQDPLVEVNLGSDEDKRLTYISARLYAQQQEKLKELLTEYKDCFTWNYGEMPRSIGTFEWVVMPFGLKNAGATYQRAMNFIFHDLIDRMLEVYIDDIIVKSKSQADHWADLELAFERMRKYNLKMNSLKCAFGVLAENFLDS
uniref:Reverse transcriptase domain-containing protein n=1 Tax=Ananas comosus var. bracteatus TaxID=296719 RepID=A0A6V7PS16_ANACO|nr:unnamed protein product [Ananas comosus var. bracteatus]